jgi:hypothetical protein
MGTTAMGIDYVITARRCYGHSSDGKGKISNGIKEGYQGGRSTTTNQHCSHAAHFTVATSLICFIGTMVMHHSSDTRHLH